MEKLYPLVRLLADGEFHSGELLSQRLGVTRASVWKQVKRLADLPGIRIDAVRGRGYRLAEPLELLEEQQLLDSLGVKQRSQLARLHLLPSIHSTNRFLLDAEPPAAGAVACLAEWQTAGKGRAGRNWTSTFGQNIYLSLDRVFDLPIAGLSGLSLAAGAVLADVLRDQGVEGVCLKWPNDIHIRGKKLAGVLVEASGETGGPARAVIGIGINLRMHSRDAHGIDQPWIDLASTMPALPSRNELAGRLLDALLEMCLAYQRDGLSSFLPRWSEHDQYQGQTVQLIMGERSIKGQYLGVDKDGGIILDSPQGRRVYYSGEVSMRGVS